jgi:hypothetical protein
MRLPSIFVNLLANCLSFVSEFAEIAGQLCELVSEFAELAGSFSWHLSDAVARGTTYKSRPVK